MSQHEAHAFSMLLWWLRSCFVCFAIYLLPSSSSYPHHVFSSRVVIGVIIPSMRWLTDLVKGHDSGHHINFWHDSEHFRTHHIRQLTWPCVGLLDPGPTNGTLKTFVRKELPHCSWPWSLWSEAKSNHDDHDEPCDTTMTANSAKQRCPVSYVMKLYIT